jgi:hypothetical protein
MIVSGDSVITSASGTSSVRTELQLPVIASLSAAFDENLTARGERTVTVDNGHGNWRCCDHDLSSAHRGAAVRRLGRRHLDWAVEVDVDRLDDRLDSPARQAACETGKRSATGIAPPIWSSPIAS